ncbi:MAG TPA: putative quinol monooxygenase [Sphingobium sp.]
MLLAVGTVRLPPGDVPRAISAMAHMVASSRAEDGCMDYCYVEACWAEDVLDPGLIHVRESWGDRAALDAHFASAHIVGWRAT